MSISLNLPLNKEMMRTLRIGDVLLLNGDIYTARDAAHQRIKDTISRGEVLPLSLHNATVFYTGPCPAKPGAAIGPLSPTTSLRMDAFVELMFEQGMSAMIGKGDRSSYVPELCQRFGGVYLLGIGGAAALIAANVLQAELIAYEDLGTEAIRRLVVQNMKVIVGIDTTGAVLMEQEIPRYRQL